MASGSSGRASSPKPCFFSYDDFIKPELSNGALSDSAIGSNSGKDFHKSRMSRSELFPAPVHGQHDESVCDEVIASVEKSMKRYTDNIMRFLEGISSRLSQLELYCYNLDKSIGEMRSDLGRDHGDANTKLKSLEKHLHEVHRSVQILRDKQELAETQKELAKIQVAQKESSSSSHAQSNEERPPSSNQNKADNAPDTHSQQLALALPHQVAPPQQQMPPSSQAPPQNLPPQPQAYYFPPNQFPAPLTNTQHPQNQYIPSDPQYQTPQVQDLPRVAPQPAPSQVNPTPPVVPQYQQQWTQQVPPQQVPPAPPTSMPPQMRPQSPSVYHTYARPQSTNTPLPESHQGSMPMQIPLPGVPQAGSGRADAMPYGYGGAGRTSQPQQQPPQQLKGGYAPHPSDGYGSAGPYPPYPPSSRYMIYDSEGGRSHHPPHQPHFPQAGYPPTSPFPNQPPPSSPNHLAQNHPYGELIEKLASMGFRGDHIASVIQKMEEIGQPIDFNSVLDRLNVHSSGGSQRGWSR